MYFVYFLKSERNNDIYVGSTKNTEKRLKKHNSGKVRSTKGYRPWILLETKNYETRKEAMEKERFYKTGQQKEILRKKYCNITA